MFGLRFCARTFSSCSEQGPLFIEVHGPLTIAASPVAEHRLQTHRLSSCGSRAQPLRGMRDLPRPGLELVSPALAGRLPTTAPPGKPLLSFLLGKNQWFMPRTKCSIIPFLFDCIFPLNIFSIPFFFKSFNLIICFFNCGPVTYLYKPFLKIFTFEHWLYFLTTFLSLMQKNLFSFHNLSEITLLKSSLISPPGKLVVNILLLAVSAFAALFLKTVPWCHTPGFLLTLIYSFFISFQSYPILLGQYFGVHYYFFIAP